MESLADQWWIGGFGILCAILLTTLLNSNNREKDQSKKSDPDKLYKQLVIHSIINPPASKMDENRKKRYELASRILLCFDLSVSDLRKFNSVGSKYDEEISSDSKNKNLDFLLQSMKIYSLKKGPVHRKPEMILEMILAAVN